MFGCCIRFQQNDIRSCSEILLNIEGITVNHFVRSNKSFSGVEFVSYLRIHVVYGSSVNQQEQN